MHESTSENEPAHRTLSRVRRALGLESERGDVREASSQTGKTKPETVGRFQIKIQPSVSFALITGVISENISNSRILGWKRYRTGLPCSFLSQQCLK